MGVRAPRVGIRPRSQRTIGYWVYRIRRNILDHPWRSLSVVMAVLVGVCIAITIIAASHGIEDKINAMLDVNKPGQAQRLKEANISLKDIQDVLATTRGILSKLAIGSTVALVGLVTWLNTSQRRREISLNRQDGMHMREALGMLVAESFVLCSIGGILGIIAGNILCAFVNYKSPLLPMEPSVGDVLSIFPVTILLTFAVTTVIAFIYAKYVNVNPNLT
ncbi:MAG TPA: FtsX-like permease family protein [Ktedonobacterales bacterium]|nr:FtsX-like permease family protein [Ktedonobacterales bacterium]